MSFLRDLIVKEATREVAKEFRKEIRTLLRAAMDRAVKKGKKLHDWYNRERTWKDEVVDDALDSDDPDAQLLLEEALREDEALSNLEEDNLPSDKNQNKEKENNDEHADQSPGNDDKETGSDNV